MNYKIGDKVKIKSLEWYNANKDEEGNIIFEKNGYYVYFSKYDVEYCGKVMTISDISNNCYIFEEAKMPYLYCDEMIECLVTTTIPYVASDNTPLYEMSYEKSEEYISKRGLDIPWNDCDVFIDNRDITRTVGNVLKWADENPKDGLVNKQEFIEKTISYFTPILKTYCSEECVKELIDGFVNSLEE